MFNMTHDDKLFIKSEEFLNPIEIDDSHLYKKNKNGKIFLPLYEGKTVNLFDHRYNSAERGKGYQYKSIKTEISQHKNINYEITPSNWVRKETFIKKWNSMNILHYNYDWFIVFRSTSRRIDKRTFFCSIIPKTAVGNSLFLILPNEPARLICCLLTNLSCFCFDYIVRQKIGGINMNFFIVEQFPVLPPEFYSDDLITYVIKRVIKLQYTSKSLSSFAKDCGFNGEPYEWDEEERKIMIAELDALFFHLYKLNESDIEYVMETFPTIKRNDIEKYGSYKTKILILKYFRNLKENPILKTVNWDVCKDFINNQIGFQK